MAQIGIVEVCKLSSRPGPAPADHMPDANRPEVWRDPARLSAGSTWTVEDHPVRPAGRAGDRRGPDLVAPQRILRAGHDLHFRAVRCGQRGRGVSGKPPFRAEGEVLYETAG